MLNRQRRHNNQPWVHGNYRGSKCNRSSQKVYYSWGQDMGRASRRNYRSTCVLGYFMDVTWCGLVGGRPNPINISKEAKTRIVLRLKADRIGDFVVDKD